MIDDKIMEVVNKYHNGQQALIICPTNSIAISTAIILSKGNFKKFSRDKEEMVKIANELRCEELKTCLLKGVGFIDATCKTKLRVNKIVDQSFKENLIFILTCTLSSAVEMNLRSNVIIFKGTFKYVNANIVQYNESEISKISSIGLNIESTKMIIITRNDMKNKYEKILNNIQLKTKIGKPLESKLLKNLCEFINSEIVLNHLKSYADVLDYIKSTYLYQCLLVNPDKYVSKGYNVDESLEKWITTILKHLNLFNDFVVDVDQKIDFEPNNNLNDFSLNHVFSEEPLFDDSDE